MSKKDKEIFDSYASGKKEIAKAEGVTQQMVSKSLDQAMKNRKGILKL